ncbi:MAG: hypothetical protein KBT03_03735 [Bacteroidales bacterium]|nr:hypothetical protein [Candidatus Scybalousia scybalohippi]
MAKKKNIYKLEDIIPLLTEEQLNVASGMIKDAVFMEKQLAKLRDTIEEEGVSENYQYGSKQTAAMTSYLQIQKQYGVIVRYLTDLIPTNATKKNNDELLEFLRAN